MCIKEVVKDMDIVAELMGVKTSMKAAIWAMDNDEFWMVGSTEHDAQVQKYGSALEAVLRFQKIIESIKDVVNNVNATYKVEKWGKPFYCHSDEFLNKMKDNNKFPCYFKSKEHARVDGGVQFLLELPATATEEG